jgi:hypothetical protein
MSRRALRWVFGCGDTLALEVLRIGLGLALLLAFAPLTLELETFYGPDGWISEAAALEIGGGPAPLLRLGAPWQRLAFHLAFLASAVALTLGWRTRWVKWVAWLGFLAYVQRNPAVVYGVDRFLASFLPILCLAPVGRRWALDGRGAPAAGAAGSLEAFRASACVRLLQLQMAVIFLFAGAHKLQGEMWWSGHALWIALNNYEFARWPTGWLAERYWLANLAAHGALLVEVAYPFLVWGRRSRPWILAGAGLLHLGIGASMGLQLFALVALCGHAAFVPDAWWLRLRAALAIPFRRPLTPRRASSRLQRSLRATAATVCPSAARLFSAPLFSAPPSAPISSSAASASSSAASSASPAPFSSRSAERSSASASWVASGSGSSPASWSR